MKLVRLIYFSCATRDMALSDLKEILTVARENNNQKNICGMLCYDNQHFLQVLEGDRNAVSELYLAIADDPRHDAPTLCQIEEIEQKTFEDWNMGYAGSSSLLKGWLSNHDLRAFEPEKLSATQAFELLQELSTRQVEI